MLSFKECEKLLNKNGVVYTIDEIEIIRNVLNKIAQIELEQVNNY